MTMGPAMLVDREGWIEAARGHHDAGARLVSIWGGERAGRRSMFAAYAAAEGLRIVELALAGDSYPDLSGLFPAANRMQRAARDLLGVAAEGAADSRQWLRHGAWGADEFPLRAGFDPKAPRENRADDYPFVRVEGDGVHEIAVGPIHAGIIEPGHFRF